MKKLALLPLAIAVSMSAAAQPAAVVTYTDLVRQLTDLENLATLPAPDELCAQWSSYDRHSRYDAATDKYVGWDANGDGNGIIRKRR